MGKLSPIGLNVVEVLLKKKGSSSTKRSFQKIPARDGGKYTHREVCKGTILRTGGCISSLCSMGLWPKSRAELSRFSVQDIAVGLLKLAEAGLEGEDWRCERNCSTCTFDISGTMWMVALCFVSGMKSIWIPWLWPVFNQVFMMMFI